MSYKHRSYSPLEAEKRLKILNLLEEIVSLDSSFYRLLTAEEMLEIIKQTCIVASQVFNEDIQVTMRVNPEIIVGETNTSSDKTVAGTVNSRKKSKKPRFAQFPETKRFFQSLFGMVKYFQEVLLSENGSIEPISRDARYLMEAARTRTLDVNNLGIIKFLNYPSTVRSQPDHFRRSHNRLFASLRKASKASKKKSRSSGRSRGKTNKRF